MTRNGLLLILVGLGNQGLLPPAVAQEKADKGAMAKIIAEQFAKKFIQDKNAAEAMELTSVPFLAIEQGREQRPKRIGKFADVEKRIRAVLKQHDENGIRGKVTIAKVDDAPGAVQLGNASKEVF